MTDDERDRLLERVAGMPDEPDPVDRFITVVEPGS